MEEAAEEKLELSRELTSLRARLSAVTLQAQQREAKAQAAERAADVAERAEQHAAPLEAARQEIIAMKEQLTQAEASTACRSMYACTLLSTFAASSSSGERIAQCKCCTLVRLKAASPLMVVLNEHPYRFDCSSLCHSCSKRLILVGHNNTHRGNSASPPCCATLSYTQEEPYLVACVAQLSGTPFIAGRTAGEQAGTAAAAQCSKDCRAAGAGGAKHPEQSQTAGTSGRSGWHEATMPPCPLTSFGTASPAWIPRASYVSALAESLQQWVAPGILTLP